MGAVPQTQNKPPGKVNLLIAGITIVLLVVAAGLFLYLRHQGRETAELGAGEYGAFKVVTEDGRNYVVLSGDVISAGPEETDNITFPIQQMITLRSRQNKNAIFKVSLGSSEMPARVARIGTQKFDRHAALPARALDGRVFIARVADQRSKASPQSRAGRIFRHGQDSTPFAITVTAGTRMTQVMPRPVNARAARSPTQA